MRLRRTATSGFLICLAGLAASCSSGSESGVTVEVTISGDGVDRALVYPAARQPSFAPDLELEEPYEYLGESMVVDLPWSTTVTVVDGVSTRFEVAAFNEGDSGELTCAADWKQADADGTWDRTSSYLVSCGGDFSFRDDGEVRLDPTGRAVSFDARDTRVAEIAEAKRVEAERIAMVDAAAAAALPPEPIELDGWSIQITGVDRDARDLLAAHSTQNRSGGSNRAVLTEITATRLAEEPGKASNIKVGALGGYELDVYDADDDDCGPYIPDSYLTLYGLLAEQQQGDEVVFNTCLELDEDDADQSLAVVSVFLGSDDPVVMRLPTTGPTGNMAEASAVGAIAEYIDYDTAFGLEVVGATIDDFELLGDRIDEEIRPPRDGRSLVMVDIAITSRDPSGYGPTPPLTGADWNLLSADGTSVYGNRDRCSKVFGLFPADPSPEGGVDWNHRDDHSMTLPNEPKTFVVCFEIDAADAAGSTLQVTGGGDNELTLATGL